MVYLIPMVNDMGKYSKFLVLASIILIFGKIAFSQDLSDIDFLNDNKKIDSDTKKDQALQLPKTGVLATSQAGTGRVTASGAWGDEGVTSGTSAPISGSVSQLGWNEWVMKVFNSSQDDYRVTVRVVQYGDHGKQISAPSFTLTLKAGQSAQRTIKSSPLVKNCSLEMRNWKNLSEEKRKQEKGNSTTVEGTVEE